MTERTFSLDSTWRLRPVEPQEAPIFARGQLPAPLSRDGWIDASVPGHALHDLQAAGLLPDLLAEGNERAAWAQESRDFLYKCSFLLPAPWAMELGRVGNRLELEFESLDVVANVFLNGKCIGRSTSAFVPARFDVSEILHQGENIVVVHFESPLAAAVALQRESGALSGEHDTARMHLRRPQFSTGWSMAPRLSGCGVTGAVRLRRIRGGQVDGLQAVVKALSSKEARVAVEVDLEVLDPAEYQIESVVHRIEPVGSGRETKETEVWSKRKTMTLDAGRFRYSESLTIENPALWWPLGVERGRRTLYRARVVLRHGGETVAETDDIFGLRKAELLSQTESGDQPFTFKINGEGIFARGAIVVPPHAFWARITPAECIDLVDQAATANLNMLRVWGGGTYLPDAFYRRCDELGIMVWQDFMFSRAEYPESKEFWALCQAEARHQVRRLRNHPALVLWCGNDGSELTAERNGGNWQAQSGTRLFVKLLPGICEKQDPSRPYWRSSPFGGSQPNSPDAGDFHGPSSDDGWQPGDPIEETRVRFVSEFGCQSLPGMQALRAGTKADDARLSHPGFASRQKHAGGNERMLRQVASLIRLPETLEELVYLSQWVQAHALAGAIDQWRAGKPFTMGTLIWHLNDCWPGITWSVIDYLNRPKLAFWAMREAFAPLTPALLPADEGVRPVVLNGGPSWQPPREVVCRLKSYSLDGELLHYEDREVIVAGGGKAELGLISHAQMMVPNPSAAVIAAELCEGEHMIAGRLHAPDIPQRMQLQEPHIDATLDCIVAKRRAVLLLRSRTIVRGVELAVEDIPEAKIRFENGFDIWPSREVWVQIEAPRDLDPERLSESLRFRCLNDAVPGRKVTWRPLPLKSSESTALNSGVQYMIPTARVRLSDIVRKIDG